MPEQVNTPAPTESANNGQQPGDNGNDPAKNGNTQAATAPDVDFSKLSDEQLAKVLEDPRTFNLPRIKELREKAQKAKEYESEQAKKAEEDAIKKGDFEKVLAERDAKIQELSAKLQNGQLDNTLRAELQKSGVKNIEAALRLVDKSGLKIGDGGQVEGLEAALQNVKSMAPEIFTSTGASVSSPTNPGNPGNGEPVKMSNLRDSTWFNDPANASTIKAIREGKISVIDD